MSYLWGGLTPLDDGSFLLHDELEGLVVRFDEHMETQSHLLGKRLFVLDTAVLKQLLVPSDETYDYQASQNAVYEYLTRDINH